MKVSREKLLSEAEATGFRPDMLEKVFHLLALLEGIRSHPYLKDRLALKGGTALNLFVFDVPRLSVDIDLNYTGAVDRTQMLEERPKIDQAIQAVCGREGLSVRRAPGDEHAGGKWSLRYESALGQGGNLALDLNFLLRVPLWPALPRDSRPIGSFAARRIPVLDIHELAAGKLVALLSRHAGRDLFDAHRLLTQGKLDREQLRLAFVVYGAMSRKDWRTVTPEEVQFETGELRDQLIPLLQSGAAERTKSPEKWGADLLKECRKCLRIVLPLAPGEKEFLDRILDRGEIDPILLTPDKDLQDRIRTHPGLEWKALNVRQHKRKDR